MTSVDFCWGPREQDILNRFSWSHYRPSDAPNIARIFHHKTGALIDMPLYDDEDGTALWPELMERLDAAPRLGTLIVMRDHPDRRQKIHLPWKEDYFRHRFAKIRRAAGIDSDVKFMGLRHGGNTESGNAGLTDVQIRALSGHKTSAMTALYTKATMQQRRAGARKRLEERTKEGNLSK
jgi:integrase